MSTSLSARDPSPVPSATPGCSGARDWAALGAVILIGSALRVWMIITPDLGHLADTDLFVAWIRQLAVHGLGGFHDSVSFCDYPPLALLVFRGIAALITAAGGALSDTDLVRMAIKAVACLADLGICGLLFWEGRRLFGRRLGVAAAALYFLNPVSLYDSAYWGQIDALHGGLMLGALILVNRRQWGLTGAVIALALLQKFQSIALLPLIIFEAYRLRRWSGVGRVLLGAVVSVALVCLPYAWSGNLKPVIERAYVNVIGQYTELSKNAYNVWYIVGTPQTSDTSVPAPIVRAAARGRLSFPDDGAWLMRLNWRVISLLVFAMCIAVILSCYSLRPGVIARFGSAGAMAFAFFLLPTEMHERYSFPAFVLLPLWAVAGAWRERVFFLLSAMMLLNLAAVQSAKDIAPQIAGANLALFIVLVGWLALSRSGRTQDAPAVSVHLPLPPEPVPAPSRLICWFRRATVVSVGMMVAVGVWLAVVAAGATPVTTSEDTVYLSTLTPISKSQGWGELITDASVVHGPLHLGGTYYLRGLGTHAPSRLEYEIPPGYDVFEAVVGINHDTHGQGSVKITVLVDGRAVITSGKITWATDPLPVRIPVAGAHVLTLQADPTADGQRADHVDWGAARFVRSHPESK